MKCSFCKMYDKSTLFSGHVFSPFNASFTVVPILLFSQSPFLATTLSLVHQHFNNSKRLIFAVFIHSVQYLIIQK